MRYTVFAVLLLSGCGASVPGQRAADPQACGAENHLALIGQDAAAALALPDPKRIYRTDEEITQDLVPNRINVQLDETDTIFAVTCG